MAEMCYLYIVRYCSRRLVIIVHDVCAAVEVLRYTSLWLPCFLNDPSPWHKIVERAVLRGTGLEVLPFLSEAPHVKSAILLVLLLLLLLLFLLLILLVPHPKSNLLIA